MSFWQRWVSALSATEGATSLALFRIAIGLGSLYTIGSVALRGLVPILWIDEDYGGYRSLGDGPWLVARLGGPTPGVTWSLVIGALVGSLLVTLGAGGRISALFALVCANNVLSINGHAGGSYDELLTNGLWLVVLSGGHQTLSLDAWRRTGRLASGEQILSFPRWLAIWQLVLMYWTTGLQKVSAYWVPGGDASALYYILQQPEWHRYDMSAVAYVFPLTQLATTVTWLWEVLAPLWIFAIWYSLHPERPGLLRRWSNRIYLRSLFAITGIVMHAVIFVTMDVGPFSLLSLAFYTTTVHPHEWEALWARLRGSPSQGASSSAVP